MNYGRAGVWPIIDFDVYEEPTAGVVVAVRFGEAEGAPDEFCMVLTNEGTTALKDKLQGIAK